MGAVILPSGSPGAEDAASGPAVALSTVVTAGGRPTSASLATHAQELQEKAHAEEGALHSLVRTHRNSIADQVTSGQALATASVSIDDSLQSVERQFDILDASHATSLTPLIDAAVSRQTYLHEAAVANLTASTLASIKKQYDGLVDLEDAMWTGHGADEAFLAQLEHAQSPNVGGIDTAVASAIRSRHDLLRTMASEQLSNAWAGAISVTEGISTSGPRIQVTKEVHLSAPRLPRLTPPSKPTAEASNQPYSVSQLFTALSRLGILPPLLRDLQARLLRAVIHPLVDGVASNVEQTKSSSVDTLQLSANPHQQPIDIVCNLKDVLLFIGNQVYPTPSDESEALAQQQFVSEIRGESFRYVLEHLLLPAMPTSTALLPAWVELVRQSAQWEEQLAGESSSATVLGDFLASGAGERWILERQRELLRRARRLVYEGWAHWAWKVVDVEVVDDAKAVDNLNAVNVKDTISPSIPTEEGDLSEPEDGDGWGFDADDDQPATKGTATLAQNDAEENDGWGFDDESPTVPQPVVPKKPVKEARRLGKKVGSKPTPPSEERLDHVEQYGAAQPSPRAPSPPSNAVKTVVTVGSTASKPTYRISTICDEVLAMAGDLANDIDGFSKLQFTHSSFASSGSRLEGQLAEVLDFIRATTPVAHAAHLKSTPAATLQLGNDFTYIGNGLHESQGVTALPTVSDVSERFKAAGRTLFLACAEDQIAHVSALLKVVNRLVDTADETVFANAQVAIQQLVEFVENLAKQTESVVEAPRYFQFLGLVIEEVCNTFLDDVLAMDDITEVESTRIGLLLGRIESLEQLFKSNTDDVSSIPTFVPHWLKLCYVNELLGANLVDITYLFENGSLVDFTPDELAKLIRALFADSEKRTKLLGKVEFSA